MTHKFTLTIGEANAASRCIGYLSSKEFAEDVKMSANAACWLGLNLNRLEALTKSARKQYEQAEELKREAAPANYNPNDDPDLRKLDLDLAATVVEVDLYPVPVDGIITKNGVDGRLLAVFLGLSIERRDSHGNLRPIILQPPPEDPVQLPKLVPHEPDLATKSVMENAG